MVHTIRKRYNETFTEKKYQQFLKDIDNLYPGAVDFRLAETPVFIDKSFTAKMIDTCENIIDLILSPEFINITDKSIPPADKVAGHYGFPEMIVFDFGVCAGKDQSYEPQLVEMQGFPSLYAFQDLFPDIMRRHLYVPENYSQYLNGMDHTAYIKLLKDVIVGEHDPEHVVLLEITPHQQKTRVDFYCTKDITGIEPVCVTELIKEGKKLFYKKNGKTIPIKRIYNRIIFDELHQCKNIHPTVDIREEYEVEWIPHPDWFYRISKYTLPYIQHPYVPETFFLNELKQLSGSLHDYVLKPLFSFAGQGVIIDITEDDINNISDPENWIMQRKVNYADVIETPEGNAKTEIRIMYLWKKGEKRPVPAINLARISKGKMIGTRYNKDKTWVGGTVAFFER